MQGRSSTKHENKHIMKKFLLNSLAIGLLVFSSSFLSGQNCPEEIAERFFQLYQKKDISQAIELMHEKKQWVERNPQQLEKEKSKLIHIGKDYLGRLISRSLNSTWSASTNQLKLSYHMVFERQFLQLDVESRKFGEQWKISHVKAIPLGKNFIEPIKIPGTGCTNGGTIVGR